jgi:hypothetical protein
MERSAGKDRDQLADSSLIFLPLANMMDACAIERA